MFSPGGISLSTFLFGDLRSKIYTAHHTLIESKGENADDAVERGRYIRIRTSNEIAANSRAFVRTQRCNRSHLYTRSADCEKPHRNAQPHPVSHPTKRDFETNPRCHYSPATPKQHHHTSTLHSNNAPSLIAPSHFMIFPVNRSIF